MGILLTQRDLEIFDTLTRRVRVLSLPQVARTWWPNAREPKRVSENRLRALADENLVRIERAVAHPELDLAGPIESWSMGEADPDFGSLSYKLQSRWSADPVRTSFISASKSAAQRFGGYGGRPPRCVERTHDIHMAQVFLHYRQHHPALVCDWVFEEQVKAERKKSGARSKDRSQKLPDAFIRTKSSTKAIEFGGAYGKDKLIAFHRYCKENSFPYEIW
jgi:hypothetical protein